MAHDTPRWIWRDPEYTRHEWFWEVSYDAETHRLGFGHAPRRGREHQGGGFTQCATEFLDNGPLTLGNLQIPEDMMAPIRAFVQAREDERRSP